jgi:hypothetical protein
VLEQQEELAMKKLFGKREKPDAKEQAKQATERLKAHITALETTRRTKQRIVDVFTKSAIAKKAAGDKTGAFNDLRTRSIHQQSITILSGQIISLRRQVEAHESAVQTKEFMQAMMESAAALKQTVSEKDANEVEAAATDITESMALVNQLQQATSQSLGLTSTNDVSTRHTHITLHTHKRNREKQKQKHKNKQT